MLRRARSIRAPVLAAALTLAACGVKGPPLPPQMVRPETIDDLNARSDAQGIRLRWSRPEHYTGGNRMRDLGKFIIVRGEDTQSPSALTEIPVTDRERFRVERRFSYLDTAIRLGRVYSYQVFSETVDGYRSEPSNEALVRRLIPPPVPNPQGSSPSSMAPAR